MDDFHGADPDQERDLGRIQVGEVAGLQMPVDPDAYPTARSDLHDRFVLTTKACG